VSWSDLTEEQDEDEFGGSGGTGSTLSVSMAFLSASRWTVIAPLRDLSISWTDTQTVQPAPSYPYNSHTALHIYTALYRVGIAGVGGGVEPPSSCLQTLIFEWKSV